MGLSEVGAAIEDAVNRRVVPYLRRRGWRPQVIPFTGYGSPDAARILARVIMSPGDEAEVRADAEATERELAEAQKAQRGWRSFITTQVVGAPVVIRAGDVELRTRTDRSGYVDVVVHGHNLPHGWHDVTIKAAGAPETTARVQVIGPEVTFGVVSDIDDTVMVTRLPRPLIAAWNTFVRHTDARKPVPGMAELYREVLARHPDAPVFYLSTGAWNVVPTLTSFLRTHGFPDGPMLMTDWGPTNTGWFRSGQEHKRTELRDLVATFPQIKWLLVGDDGQHDPHIYGDLARRHPTHVVAIAIRELTPTEQVLAHGTPVELPDASARAATPSVPQLRGPDGYALLRALPPAASRR